MQLHDRSCFPLTTFLILLALAGSAARAVTIGQIRSPRPDGWAVDLTHTLSPARLDELNRLGEDVKTKAGAELAVVVVPSTDGADSHDFATRLFNAWGIGDKTSNNGVLLFAALNDHRAEIVVGRSLDTEGGRRESQEVMQQVMIPHFRNGDPSGAVVLGAIACARRLLGVSPLAEEVETPPGIAATLAPAPAPATPPGPLTVPQPWPARPQPVQYPVASSFSPGPQLPTFLWILGAGCVLGSVALGIVFQRQRPPRCSKCKQPMVELDEQADDAYLQPAEKVEERIGSIDYQIWSCPTCGTLTKRRVPSFFSRYQTCPECSARTLISESTTLREATYWHDGEIRIDQSCMNCSYRNSYSRYTPQLVREERYSSSPSSSSAGALLSLLASPSSPSSDSGSASSGSSSSSGFSGGSSEGGGASGSW